jgi:hypothetical protein
MPKNGHDSRELEESLAVFRSRNGQNARVQSTVSSEMPALKFLPMRGPKSVLKAEP